MSGRIKKNDGKRRCNDVKEGNGDKMRKMKEGKVFKDEEDEVEG